MGLGLDWIEQATIELEDEIISDGGGKDQM